MNKNLFVDDVRDLPPEYSSDDWIIARTPWHALYLIDSQPFDIISLDHDLVGFLGYKEITGYDILMYLVQRKHELNVRPKEIRVHSANVVAVPKMLDTIKKEFP